MSATKRADRSFSKATDEEAEQGWDLAENGTPSWCISSARMRFDVHVGAVEP